MSGDDRVAIVGAGPVGLCLALALARAGVEVTIVEQAAELPSDLRASTFHPPTLEMLDAFDLTRDLIALGERTPSWQIRLHETGEKAEFDLGILKHDTRYPFRLQCEQHHLARLALAALRKIPGVDIRFATAVTGVIQNADRAEIVTESGERIAARYVVGCVGARSIVRRSLDLAFEGTPARKQCDAASRQGLNVVAASRRIVSSLPSQLKVPGLIGSTRTNLAFVTCIKT